MPGPSKPEADVILLAADAYIVAPAIASVEGCDEITSMVLRTMGSGVGNSSVFADATTMDEKAAWIQRV